MYLIIFRLRMYSIICHFYFRLLNYLFIFMNYMHFFNHFFILLNSMSMSYILLIFQIIVSTGFLIIVYSYFEFINFKNSIDLSLYLITNFDYLFANFIRDLLYDNSMFLLFNLVKHDFISYFNY